MDITHEDRMTVWRAPSGRLHTMHTCSGGAYRRMRRVRLTRAQYDAADRCHCVRPWLPDPPGSRRAHAPTIGRVTPVAGRNFGPGQRLVLCRAGQRTIVAFLRMDLTPGRALVGMSDGRQASALTTALHALETVAATATPIRGMDRSGWHGFIRDDDPGGPRLFRELWRCRHAHRSAGAAQGCARDELRKWGATRAEAGTAVRDEGLTNL